MYLVCARKCLPLHAPFVIHGRYPDLGCARNNNNSTRPLPSFKLPDRSAKSLPRTIRSLVRRRKEEGGRGGVFVD